LLKQKKAGFRQESASRILAAFCPATVSKQCLFAAWKVFVRCREIVIAVQGVERGHGICSKFSSCGELQWNQKKKGTRNVSLASDFFRYWE